VGTDTTAGAGDYRDTIRELFLHRWAPCFGSGGNIL